MRSAVITPVPGLLLGCAVAAEVAATVLSWGREPRFDTIMFAVFGIVMVAAGALIASRHPGNPIGWLFCGFGVLNALASDVAQGWGLRGGLPATATVEWISMSSWLLSGFGWIVIFLLFPDGHPTDPRWRPVLWAGVAGLALALPGWSLSPDRGREFTAGHNPFAVGWLPTGPLLTMGMILFLGAMLASAASLVVRCRRSSGEERQQLKWFAAAATCCCTVLPLTFVLWYTAPAVAQVAAAVALTMVPVVAGVAILRYRLYDIDVIIDRTVVYGAVTVLLAVAYGLTTLVLGTALGGGSALITAAATLVVAVAFRPLRDRMQRIVDRRFHRAKYEAVQRMAGFLDELRAGGAAPEQVQDVLRDLTGDTRLRLLVFLPESQVYVDVDASAAPPPPPHRLDVERAGRPLGRILHSSDARHDVLLLRRLLETGGLAVEMTRLNVELRRQLDEVRASRARIVHAVTEERRRLERDLHDGAQQRLVSIGLGLRHAQHQLGTGHAGSATRTLDDAMIEVRLAIDELRELARGLPPSHLDAGLAPAFQDLARRTAVPVLVSVPGGRFDRGVEGAAYFIGCEALTNAVKHARATTISLSAEHHDGRLVITVSDDGVGGAAPDPGSGLSGLADRVAALGGVLRVDSRPGAGTTVTAELPCGS